MSEASDKLARTRLAIIEHVHRRESRHDKHAVAGPAERQREEGGDQWDAAEVAAASGRGGRFARLKRAAQSYWRHHPARMGVEIATPLLSKYGSQHPMAYLGIAAAAGAIIMIARPWRLISVTGVLVALAKSPQLAGVVMSAMSGAEYEDEEPY